MTMLNPEGQPVNRALNRRFRTEREIDELLGICRGLAADGKLNDAEAAFLRQWLEANRESCNQWPANVLVDRLERVFADGIMDTKEESELYRLLIHITGGRPVKLTDASLSTTLPFDNPTPVIRIRDESFCFTGKMLMGTRAFCENEVVARGGTVRSTISTELRFLVIGVVGSRDWLHSSHGRKIQKAVQYRNRGIPVSIISEKHLVNAMDGSIVN